MNEEFYQKDNFEKLLKVTIEALNKEKDQFRNQFLLLKKEDLIKTMPVTSDMPDKAKELLYRNRLAKWLTKFFLTPDKEIINHFKALGFDGKFEELFINIETVFNELRQIHTRNIVLLNYPMVVLQIAQYLEMKIPCYIYSDNEAQVVYTDRIKDDIKNQLDNLKERATRGKSEIDKILHAQVTERNKYGFAQEDLINSMNAAKFDSYFFRLHFHKYIAKKNQKTDDIDMFIELYELFRLITKNPQFIAQNEYNIKMHGYDNLRNYQCIHVKRLLYSR